MTNDTFADTILVTHSRTLPAQMSKKTSSLECVELFAGAGGLALGFSASRVKHCAILEWNKYACDTIRANRRAHVAALAGWPEPLEIDVRDVDFSKYSDASIVSGGVPCQPFSMGGLHRANLDPRDMFPSAIRAVREVSPKAFVFENVRGLTRPSFANYFEYIRLCLEFPNLVPKRNEEWEEHLARLERHKTKGGMPEYRVVARVLDAADYGVPQRRHRVFIVGVKASLEKEFTFPDATHSQTSLLFDQYVSGEYWERHKIAKKRRRAPGATLEQKINSIRDVLHETMLLPWRTVRDAISDLPDPTKGGDGVQAHVYQPGARSYAGHTGSPFDEPAKALKSGVHGVPGGENALRDLDGNVRYFTVRESARLQCFPDEFSFSGSWSEAMRQLGNAVPVRLASAVSSRVVATIG
ncbi:Modification methylase AplI [Usitatibacter rugosus]|uniref:DNA (cytosine-5-)-methyltransferase n=1 Tax=Usitatibacter rugosus TaxID=2732067 RepID=A0A6M4GU19_9PROT|nr:DNA cytosine methyltransferase [Usitatibacter rugosus]QJR10495.1 Modification methylase AplI [Usitatibacter rugosus]